MILAPLLIGLFLWAPVYAGAAPAAAPDESSQAFDLATAPPQLRKKVEDFRQDFQLMGYRFEDDGSGILAPETRKRLSVLEVKRILHTQAMSKKHYILERMQTILSQHKSEKAGDPLPDEVRWELQHLARAQREGLPKNLLQALEADGEVSTALVRHETQRAYLDSTRFWDGKSKLDDFMKGASPVLGTWNTPRRDEPYFDDPERQLGERLKRDIIAHLRKNPAGKELLERFKDKQGDIRLPAVLILKIDPNAHAIYDPVADAIVLNQTYAFERLVSGAPPREREELARALAGRRRMAARLMSDPTTRAALVERYDVMIFHELTHAWQDRRGRYGIERLRGNVPGINPLDHEHEAYLSQNRFLHHKLMADPAAALDSPWSQDYFAMLNSFSRWRDDISHYYLSTWPEGTASLATTESLQRTRVAAARRLMGEGVIARMAQTLKIQGMAIGSTEIKREKSEHEKRMKRYRDREYPEMRYESYRQAARHYASRGNLLKAFTMHRRAEKAADDRNLYIDQEEASRLEVETDAARARVEALLNGPALPAGTAIDDLVEAAGAAIERRQENQEPYSLEFAQTASRAYYRGAKHYWEASLKAGVGERKAFQEAAEALVSATADPRNLPDKKLGKDIESLRARIAAARAKDTKEKKP